MKKMCVIGAGVMGWSIAQVFATAGYKVLLCDQELPLAEKGKSSMKKGLDRLVEKGKIEAAAAQATLDNVQPAIIADTADCSLAVEAIYENIEAKKKVFKELEATMPADAILATNTSSLSITEIANALSDPGRLGGMHFFNPATLMKLVEVIGGAATRPDVLDTIYTIAQEIGKTPVRVNESPGFVVNRILIPMINEGIGVLAEGVASAEDIDTAMKLGANHPLGPLALGDLVGLDVCLAIMEVLHHETGEDKYRPHPLLRKMVRAGKLGKKTGEGFFSYAK